MVSSREKSVIDRWFFIGVGIFMLVLSLVGFGPALVAPATRRVPLPLSPGVAVHVAVSASWLVLFIVQAALVARRRTDIHRRLGMGIVVLAIPLVVTGWQTSIGMAKRGFDLSGDQIPAGTMRDPAAAPAPVTAFVLFGLLVALAAWYRRRPDVHKRLMVLAMLGSLAGAPLAHVVGHWPAIQPFAPVVFGILSVALLAVYPIYDRLSRGRVHPVSAWGAFGVFLWNAVFLGVVPTTEVWKEFSYWLVQ